METHAVLPPVDSAASSEQTVFSDLLPQALSAGICVIPAERVTLHSIELPVRSTHQRLKALPFALEDAVGCGLEHVHFALLGTSEARKALAAVVDVVTFDTYLQSDPNKSLVAEQCLIAAPEAEGEAGRVWRVYRRADRILVRASDGTGFAVSEAVFANVWRAAGKPQIESYGAGLPDTVLWRDHSQQPLPQPEIFVDLRQGRHQPSRGFGRPLKVLVACLALAAVSHLGIAVFDVRAQAVIADELRAQATVALAQRLPGATPDDPPALILRQLVDLGQPQRGSGFLPLMQRTSTALSLQPTVVQFRQLTWAEDILRLSVEAPDLGTLQRAEADLKAGGLQVVVGSASADAGAARADLTVRP